MNLLLRIFLLAASLALAAGCAREPLPGTGGRPLAPGEKRYALTGEVVRGDPGNGILRVYHDDIEGYMRAMTMEFRASRGDIANYGPGRRIRADLIVDAAGNSRLENVWPDDATGKANVEAGAKTLREDTLIRGKGAYREVGESAPDFVLYDQNGRAVESGRFRGKRVMMNFIYTRCPDPNMCPLSTANMITAQALARAAGITDVEFVSFTLDPAFDTPGILRSYAEGLKIDTGNFTFLTGPEPAIKDLFVQFGIDAEFKGDLLRHNLRTVLVDADGKIRHSSDSSKWDPAEFVAAMRR